MNIFPTLTYDLDKIAHNTAKLCELCHPKGMTVTACTKGMWGSPDIAETLAASGADYLGESRIQNLKRFKDVPCKKMLLRLPMASQADEVTAYADISLVSEPYTIKALGAAAALQNKRHGVILMIDIGDLREGIWVHDTEAIDAAVACALTCDGIELAGIGANLTCYGGVIPSVENYTLLLQTADRIRDKYSTPLPIISGGNSSGLALLDSGNMPSGINNIRINQAIFIGKELAYGNLLPGWYNDIFTLYAEVSEVRVKPSKPVGEIAKMNAFGKPPADIEDMGMRKRAVLCIGRQDMDVSSLMPAAVNGNMCEGAFFVGASSDHMIVDVNDCILDVKPGNIMAFRVETYSGMLSAMAAEHIKKQAVFKA